ncbi:RNA polymerase sigma factor [Paenibacillus pini]|uniref:RNA polymerase sigma factor n=1 Tax=Paenibacillus pini JCM 16418 TaxID=1236976 RepID=W7YMV3_9BACL|nr:RNA polymerase sigma factor [Paenibacillus pini]GAF08953.1 sigma factor, ECF subfamily [Paenibacillus pini JCM 16418]
MNNDEFIKQLMQRGKIIKHYLVRIGANPADAEEIVQDTLLKGLSNIDSIEPAKFMAWLFKVATNKYYDLYRKEVKRGKSVPIDLVSIIDDHSPESSYLQREKSQEVRGLLNQIPLKYKQVLILKYEMGLTYDEIGRLMNLKSERIKTDLYRARNLFKKIYEGDPNDEQ